MSYEIISRKVKNIYLIFTLRIKDIETDTKIFIELPIGLN